jgi:hypothetical protein
VIEVPREVYDSLVALLRDNPREPEFDGDSVVYDDGPCRYCKGNGPALESSPGWHRVECPFVILLRYVKELRPS